LSELADYAQFDPFRRPDWRFARVLQLVDQQPPARCTKHDDDYIRQARTFIVRWRNKPQQHPQLLRENPGLCYAYQLHERAADEPEPAFLVQARLLARQDPAEIAHYLGTIPQTIHWYEKLFFNVTDRLDRRDWITKHVLIPALTNAQALRSTPNGTFRQDNWARPFLDGTLKLFAYFGGPLVLDVLIAGFEYGKPLQSLDDLPDWFDRQWTLTIRRRSHQAALQFEVNRFNVMELFSAHQQIMALAQREDNPQQQRSRIEQHIQNLLDDLPFAVGSAGVRIVEGTPLAQYDNDAAELRDRDLFTTQHGQPLSANRLTALPPPPSRVSASVQEEPHADAPAAQ
jgi:hypothetical protein